MTEISGNNEGVFSNHDNHENLSKENVDFSEIENCILELAKELQDLFTKLQSGIAMDRSYLKKVDALFAKASNEISRLGIKIIVGEISEEQISKYQLQMESLHQYYQTLIQQVDNLNPASKEARTLTIEETVEILEKLIKSDSDYYNDVDQRFLELINKQPELKRAEYRCKRAFQYILTAGDTGEKDFGVWFPAITEQLIDKMTDFIDEGRYLFTKPDPAKVDQIGVKDVDSLPIDEEALSVWDYVVNRIKDKYGGIISDPALHGARRYDYNSLSGDNIKYFEEHLKDKFKNVNSDKLQQIIKYCQSHDAKTTAYTAWLARETTRSHGSGPAKKMGVKFEDPLFTVAFFAAGIYGRGRYGNVIPNNTSPDLVLMPKEIAVDIIPKKSDGSLNEEKRSAAADLWDIVDSWFVDIMWRGTPTWVKDVRDAFGINENKTGVSQMLKELQKDLIETSDIKKRKKIDEEIKDLEKKLNQEEKPIDLYKTMFPMPGEVTVDCYKVELEKRKLKARHNETEEQLKNEKIVILENFSNLRDQLIDQRDKENDSFRKNEINLTIRELDSQKEKEELIINNKIKSEKEKFEKEKMEFIEKWQKFGYGSKFEEIGIERLTKDPEGKGGRSLTVSQYNVAFDAMSLMSDFFHQPGSQMTWEQCVEKFKYWMDKIIGKAKLVPGRHYFLFPYLTMFAISKIVSVYQFRADASEVKKLINKFRSELKGATGVPDDAKEKILGFQREEGGKIVEYPGYLDLDELSFGVFPSAVRAGEYKRKLYKYRTRIRSNDIEEKFGREVFLGLAAKERDGSPIKVKPPWDWDVKADKDTSGK